MSLLSWLLVTLAGLSLASMVVSLTIANRSAREARSTIFPIVREEETLRARRARIATSVTGVIAAIMAGAFFVSGRLPSSITQPQQSPPERAASVDTPVAVAGVPTAPPINVEEAPTSTQQVPPGSPVPTSGTTSGDTLASLATSTPLPPTLTPTRAPSPTPSSTPPSPSPTRPPLSAPTGAQMGPIVFSAQVSSRRQPISATDVFSDTLSRVYATFPYDGMQDGLEWTQVWYFNDIEFSRGVRNWEWGSADRSYVFTNLVGAGNYRLELFVNDDMLAAGEFTVEGPIAVGGPRQQTPENQEGSETPQSP